ncbi:hypothetical protein BDR04DRAFT_1115839 [Suillus decipiens]|nr:hypothetical protein BDR04DRAFT_1115839 [Suillus decipiens]
MTRYPNWGKALSNLRCMVRVAVCRGDYSSLFSLVMADYVAERTMVIRSIWPETLIRCNLQQKDLERVTIDDDIMSDVDILALGDAWFSLFMYDNRRQVSASIVTNRAGFDLNHIFGIALHDKIMSIISRLMPPESNCLPLADNGLVWFLCHQITKELVYHIVFRHNTTPRHRICLADLDPASFREAAHPPVATLSLVITSCYDVLLGYFNNEFKDSHEFIYPSEMHTHVCETLPMLFGQSDDPSHAPFMATMNALCTIKKGDVQRLRIHINFINGTQWRDGVPKPADLDFAILIAIMRHSWAIAPKPTLPGSLFTAACVLFGLVDPLDIKALIEVSLKEDVTQTGLQHEEESCLEYLKRGGRFLMEERMDRAQIEVSLFSSAIANLCEELDVRAHLDEELDVGAHLDELNVGAHLAPCRADPKVVTPEAVESVGACHTCISVNGFQPTKAIQDKCHAWLRASSQSQDITQDSNASRILHDFPLTLQCPCLHDHVLRAQYSDAVQPNDQFIPLPHVMKTWVDNFTYSAYMSTSLAESSQPLRIDHGNSFTATKFKPLEMLKSDFHILDLKKQRAQSEVDMLSEAIVRIAEFHRSDDGTTETDESDSPDAWSDDWMSTSSTSSRSISLS